MLEYNVEDGGLQFDPYDDELIQEYLIPKLRGEDCGFIVMKNVYEKEPWLMGHTRGSIFQKNEWYYFTSRTQVSKKKNGCGKNSKRKITGDNEGGSWKLNATDNILDVSGNTIGKKQTLKFNKSNNNKRKQKRGDDTSCATVRGSESSWIMTEYILPEGKKYTFQELILCKIHVIEKSKKKENNHEASTSYHHESIPASASYHHESIPASTSYHHESIPDSSSYHHESIPASSSYHHESIPASSSKPQPINLNQQIVQSPSLEQLILCGGSGPGIPHSGFQTSRAPFSEQQPEINDYDSSLASLPSYFRRAATFVEQTNIDQETYLAPLLEQQPMNFDHETPPSSFFSEQQLIDSFDHETFLDQQQPRNVDHESVLDSFSLEQQPISEAHRHDSEIPYIGLEDNGQVFKTSHLSDDDTATVKETNGKEKCENLGLEKDKQPHIGAPLVCLGSEQEAEEEKKTDWLQEFRDLLITPNGSDLSMEEDDDILTYHTPSCIDQDLLDQYATLRPPRKLSTLGI